MSKLSLAEKAELFCQFCETFNNGSGEHWAIRIDLGYFRDHPHLLHEKILKRAFIQQLKCFKAMREFKPYYHDYQKFLRQRHLMVKNNKEENHGKDYSNQLAGVNE